MVTAKSEQMYVLHDPHPTQPPPYRDMSRVAEEVTAEALRQGSVDNVSVVIVAFNQDMR